MATFYCINCGNAIPQNARFCPACGAPITSQQPQQPAAYGQPNATHPAYQTPPPLANETGYGQQPMRNYTPANTPKKSNGALIALIIVLALAILGGGGWALYNYVIKPNLEKKANTTTEESDDDTSFSTSPDANQSYTTSDEVARPAPSTDQIEQGFELDEQSEPNNDEVEQTNPIPKPQAAPSTMPSQSRQIPNVPKTKNKRKVQRPSRNEPFGMTDEEAAQMRRNKRPNRSEPFGMTDEEAAQMGIR